MFSLSKRTAVVALSAGLALSLSACGGSSSTTSSSGSSSGASAKPTPVAAIDSLSGVHTQVTLDPGFLSGLQSLKLTPGVIGGATLDASTGVLTFPITGGNVTYYDPSSGVTPYVQGKIMHAGSGISLEGGGTKVELTDFVVDPASSMLTGKVTANGKVAAESAPLFFLDGRTLQPLQVNKADGTAVLEGTTVSLTKAAADLLNKTYGTDALKEFFKVGVAKITVKLPS